MRRAVDSAKLATEHARLGRAVALATLTVLAAALAVAQPRGSSRNASPAVPDAAVRMLQVRPNIYMLSAGGANVTVQLGKHGALLVDAPPPEFAQQALAEIAKLSAAPIRYVVSTSDAREHIAGNEQVASLGQAAGASRQGPGANPVLLGSAQGMTILAHENVLNRLTQATDGAVPRSVLPTTEYYEPTKDFSFNGEPIVVYHMPNAHSDGDSVVLFRSSDVISAGDVFTPDRYPNIDRSRGGSVQGVIAALNSILALTVPEAFAEGGTKVIPGHGRLSEEIDVVEYRDMVVIVADRIADMIAKDRTLAQVQAARPTLDYDAEYRNPAVTPSAFVAAVYASLEAGDPSGGNGERN
jgi:glyoxylase-like metal-dependent hydrolase (beta-lactamase superfamily II)